MRFSVNTQRVFMLSYFFILFLAFLPILFFNKKELFIMLNGKGNLFLNNCFRFVTIFGNGFTAIFIYLILFFKKIKNRYMLAGGASLALLTLIIKGMKLILFKNVLRPSFVIAASKINLVASTNKQFGSFPSGHSAIIFSIIVFIILLKNIKWYNSLLMLLFAVLVAYSRIYLGMHFYRDVYVGSLIGGCTTIAMYSVMENVKKFPMFLSTSTIDTVKRIINSFTQ